VLFIQGILQQAQWAVAAQQQSIYLSHLKEAKDIVTQYFVLEDKLTKGWLASLGELEKVSIEATLPKLNDIIQSLVELLSREKKSETTSAEKKSSQFVRMIDKT